MAGITLKNGFSDEALFITGEVGVIMGLTRRVFLRIFTVAFGQEKGMGQGLHFVPPGG